MSWLLNLTVEPTELELVSSTLWDLGTTGLAELPGSRVIAGFESREQAEGAARSFGRGTVSAYDPSIVPQSEPSTVRFRDQTIDLPDTGAFGHGAHPTTRLALEAVSRLVGEGDAVLDMGCGTGVLAIAASLAGADVTAVDNDADALAATATNAAANNVDIRSASTSPNKTYDLVVANMLLADLRGVADLIDAAISPGGKLTTTGFLASQADEVEHLFPELVVTHRASSGDWVLLDLNRPAAG